MEQSLHALTSKYRGCWPRITKQLLDEAFVISGIIKVEVSVISRSRRLRLITLTETLIIPDITKTESNNCFIIHCFEENNDKHTFARNLNWYWNWNSCIARATRRLVSYLLICRLCWFPKLAVGSQPMRRQIVSTMYNNATYYHALPYPKTMENEIWTKDKTELQHLYSP